MIRDLDRVLVAVLARTLEFDPRLSPDDAAGRVVHLDAALPALEPHMRTLMSDFRQRGVINPRWLMHGGTRPYFFLANGRAGLLSQVIGDSEKTWVGVSQYVVYGHWDSLLILYGSEDEAASLLARMREGAYEDIVQFVAQEVLLSYRHKVPQDFQRVQGIRVEDVNDVAIDYENAAHAQLRTSLLTKQVLLGSTLTLDGDGKSPYPITAFVGISVRTRLPITGPDVLEALLAQEDLSRCMIDLFQIDQGVPYRYFAKIACASMEELDAATNAIAYASHGGTRFEGETLVVARGSGQPPLARKPDEASLMVAPDVGPAMRTAQRIFGGLGQQERMTFNALSDERQLAALYAFAGLQASVDENAFDPETHERIEGAIATFARETTKPEGVPNLTGAVVEVATMVEANAKRMLSKLAYSVCGNDQGAIQRELKLPSRKIRMLSLGKVVQAYRVAADHDMFEPIHQHIPDEWVDRLSDFADARNSWAHGATTGTEAEVIDQAFHAMREGVALAGWLTRELGLIQAQRVPLGEDQAGQPALRLSPRAANSEFKVFVSHSSTDRPIAERLAFGLQAVGYGSWFAEWELRPGDSIVTKIEAALSASDVLLVVLSKRSIVSEWVQRELNTVLMAQLSGQNVRVIPVLIEDCEIPALLRDTIYVDLRSQFEKGFLSLLDALRQHRSAIDSDSPAAGPPAPRRPVDRPVTAGPE